MHFYSEEEIEYLIKVSSGRPNKEITRMFNEKFKLNISKKAISGTRKRHGIKNGLDGSFKKGHVPHNKGKKGISYEGMKPTQFKKDNKPHNYKPVGSERITKDGYVEIKIADPKTWKGKHILIWEAANGTVPKGHVIIFGDGNNRNFDINNLLLVSRAQLLILNSKNLIKNDAYLTKTGIVIASLHQKINERS